jgi:hypothetical protein
MRTTEKTTGILILALMVWAIIMLVTTNLQFQGSQSNRILLAELGSDASSLNLAVQARDTRDSGGVARNVELLKLNTRMDFLFIFLYWLTFLSLAYLAGRLGKPFFASWGGSLVRGAAAGGVLENGAVLSALRVHPFTDQIAVDIAEFSEWKWAFFFLACLLLGLAIALNHRVSQLRRISGVVFIAAAFFGILGLSRHRISLDFTIWMFGLANLLVTAALLLSLWKIYQSLKELNHVHAEHRAGIAA